jgi:molybdate transport system substrate-binding protein
VLLLLALMASASACGTGDGGGSAIDAITVAAAASLRTPFQQLGDVLEAEGEISVTFSFDASSSLATQILEGAPADVYASAAIEDMDRLVDDGLVRTPQVFARNRLAIVTAAGNPAGISGLEDLTDAGVVSLCDAAVPCGRYARRALDAAGVSIPEDRVSRGQNATATLTAVAEGDAVAGIVYATDAIAAGDAVESVPLPADDVVASYLIAVVDETDRAAAARAFVDLVSSDEGQAVLEDHGFVPAP